MFGGGKKPQQQPSKEFDLDELLNSTLGDLDQDLDMNDPELLKQLQELSSTTTVKKPKTVEKPKRKAPPQGMEIDIDSYAALAQGDDDIHVELDENDFNDPHLLNELSSLSNTKPEPASKEALELMNMGFTERQATKALDMFNNDLERAANYLFDSPPQDEDEHIPDAAPTVEEPRHEEQDYEEPVEEEQEDEESIDPQFWKDKAQEYQKMALEAKKLGDKKKAVLLLRESKGYTQKYQDLLELHQPMQQEEPIRAPTPPPRPITPPLPIVIKETPKPVIVDTPPPTTQNLQQTQDLLAKVITLQKQYKEAALHYKFIGNMAVAKKMVKTSKDLLHTGINLKNGEIYDLSSVKLPSAPDMSLGDGKIRQVEAVSVGASSYEQVESQLTYQLNICHNLSVQRGVKSSKKSKLLDSADAYAQMESAIASDLVQLKSNAPALPDLHYEHVNYTYKNILDTIPENMMEFKLVRCISLPTLGISTHLDPFVAWDFGGWPPENTAQAAMNKGETPVSQGINPQFDVVMQIPISRTNRLFLRYLQRKKLTIEVFHNKYTYGMFRRPVSLGKVVVPMDTLLTKSSLSGSFDLLDANRKKTGGKIELQVNLREPLNGEDIVKRSERWVVLDAFGSNVSQCLSQAGLTTGGPYIKPADVSSPSSPMQQGQSSTSSPAPMQLDQPSTPVVKEATISPPVKKPAQQPIEPAGDSSELEQAEEELNSVDSIVSNMVLEHELNLVNSALASSKKDDLLDRKQALEIKMNMLIIQVQTGLLDMDTYLANVEKRIDSERKLALVFKKHNRLDLAKAALVRKKVMQDELNEAREAMAAQEED